MKKVLGIIFFSIGIIIIAFPLVNKLITSRSQDQLLDDVKSKILENGKKGYSDEDEEEDDEEDIDGLELENNDENDIKNSLNADISDQKVFGIIEIKKLDITFAIVKGTKKRNIRVAIGHMNKTAGIGKMGNCVLAGHRGGIYGQFFKHIDKLEKDDEIILTDLVGNEYSYSVYDKFVVEPNDYSVTEQNTERSILTLITCEDKGKRRLIVRAKLNE